MVGPTEIPFLGGSVEGMMFGSKNSIKKFGEQEKSGITKMLFVSTMSVALGCALPAGFNFSVLNVPQEIIQKYCNETIYIKYNYGLTTSELNLLWAFIVSIFLVGGMIGAGVAGWVLNVMGRKRAILFNQFFGIAAAILFIASKAAYSVEMIIIGRILVGFYSGFTFSAVPVYLTEISPVILRGALGVVQPLGLTVGILIAQILGFRNILGNEECWNMLLGIFCVPIIFFSILFYFCPESPKYLYIVKEKEDAAIAELARLRGVPCTHLQADVMKLREEMKLNSAESKWSLRRLLFSPEVRLPLLILCALQGGQQLAGINAVFYYSTSIFTNAGIKEPYNQYASVGACVINAIMAVLALIVVSKCGRRKLSMLSIGSVILLLITLTVALVLKKEVQWMSYVAVVALLSYVLAFGVGLGPIPYFIGSELFQQGPKAAAMSLGCWMNWAGNFLVAISFPPLQEVIGDYCFLIFAAIALCLLIFIYKYLPETKDKDPVEVSKLFRNQYETSCATELQSSNHYPVIIPLNETSAKLQVV